MKGRRSGTFTIRVRPVLSLCICRIDSRAAIFVINDPLAEGERIRHLVAQGYLVRTRADADTEEARRNDTWRRDAAAFASGAPGHQHGLLRPLHALRK